MPVYKTTKDVETNCCGTVQRRVNYGNLMNMFVCRKHVAYYSLSFTCLENVVRQNKFGNGDMKLLAANPLNVHLYDLVHKHECPMVFGKS